jgi:hypothetical protein
MTLPSVELTFALILRDLRKMVRVPLVLIGRGDKVMVDPVGLIHAPEVQDF